MADIISDFLERAKKANDDPQIQAALAAEFALEPRPEPEWAALRAAIDGAALLHWFDSDLLEKMLNVSTAEALERLEALKSLPFVERYRRGESGPQNELHNVHEATRLGWRRQMARENPDGFRGLSIRAAASFAEDRTPVGRIEYIYHLLCGDPERGADELEGLGRDWIGYAHARPEDCYALAAVLRELQDTALVQGRARASALISIGWVREIRGETAQLADMANEALLLARGSADRRLEADAQCLVGDALLAQDQPVAAQAAFAEFLAISQRLADEEPSIADWQRELAVAYNRAGDVLQAQDKLVAAQAAFAEFLAISQRLAVQDPSNAGWQRDLGVAYNRVGGVQLTQGQAQVAAAQAAFAESLAISRRLAEQDSSNSNWQRDLGAAHNRMGSVLEAQGQPAAAQAAFAEDLTISRRLAKQDPSHADWQRDLAVACVRLARAKARTSKNNATLKLYEESLCILTDLADRAPGLVERQKERGKIEAELNAFRKKQSWFSAILKQLGRLKMPF